jgi:hypothetical protein
MKEETKNESLFTLTANELNLRSWCVDCGQGHETSSISFLSAVGILASDIAGICETLSMGLYVFCVPVNMLFMLCSS